MFRYMANHTTLDSFGEADRPLVDVMRALEKKTYGSRNDAVRDLNGAQEKLQGRMGRSDYVCGPILGDNLAVNAFYRGDGGIVNLGRLSLRQDLTQDRKNSVETVSTSS